MSGEQPREDQAAIEREILAMRDAGASWKEIEERFGVTRQQARYAYQRGKREVRRAARRNS